MVDTELCRLFLQCILNIKIHKVELVNTQKTINNRQNVKGIRLDVYISDDEYIIYNIEMQVKNRDIPRRAIYYQSSIDMDLVPKGETYKKLNTSYIIFICTFDLFGQGRHLYSFQNRCDQSQDLILGDGAYKVFLNTKGTLDDVNQDIRDFLMYVDNSTEEVANKSNSELVKKVHEKIETIRNNEESEVEFMTYMDKILEVREDALEEGIEKGMIKSCQKLLKEGMDIEFIMRITELSKEQIEKIKKNMMAST